jgi:dipeptidyl aminopeptidase/acylaminoacyl peptidase
MQSTSTTTKRRFAAGCFKTCLSAGFVLALCSSAIAGKPRSMEIDDLFGARRLGDPQISPDGRWVAYSVTEIEKAENSVRTDIFLVSVQTGETRQLISSPKTDRHPRWSPDGRWLAFESNRSGKFQIYVIEVPDQPQKERLASAAQTQAARTPRAHRQLRPDQQVQAKQLTSISTGARQPRWSPDGRRIAFVSAVFPEHSALPYPQSDAANRKKIEERQKSKVQARIISQLLYRNFDSWVDDKRLHLFVVPVHNGSAAGDPRNVTPGDRDAVPTSSTFSAGDEFDFSPDGRFLACTAAPTPAREQAWSTNHDIYEVDLEDGQLRRLTTNPAADGLPRYSPDGKYLAYRAQAKPGFEADRWQLMLLDRSSGQTRSLTAEFDSAVESFTWAAGSDALFIEAEEKGSKPIWSVALAGGNVTKVFDRSVNSSLSVGPGAQSLVFSHQSFSRPVEICRVDPDGSNFRCLTGANDQLFSGISMTQPESVWFEGASGTPVQMWIIKPPDFDPARKYPLVFWVHGGPQGAYMDLWSYRWNPQLWAAQGYVLALPNPRGSTGFGQQFVEEISRDWGGKVYEDLMAGLAFMERLHYIDPERMAAAGASYGGYMMNWFQGHTGKFKTLVTHCGVFNFWSMYGSTEELWFPEWEHGIPWETAEFEKFSPHLRAGNFKTPNLVIHNELDFRVPITEGLSLFTTLQRQGVRSKLLYFPDEGHWVLKPLNSELWHRTIFDWLAEYLKQPLD